VSLGERANFHWKEKELRRESIGEYWIEGDIIGEWEAHRQRLRMEG